MTHGAVVVAYGDAARREARACIAALREHNPMPVVVLCDEPLGIPGVVDATGLPGGRGARWAKLHADRVVPRSWQSFVYLDADTRVNQDIGAGFEILADGWDVALAHSNNQADELFWHVDASEVGVTLYEIENVWPLQLQCGVMFCRRNDAVAALFEAWREEWQRWQGQDQAAFVRALHRAPVRLWLLGQPWNGGAVIGHRWGAIRGK